MCSNGSLITNESGLIHEGKRKILSPRWFLHLVYLSLNRYKLICYNKEIVSIVWMHWSVPSIRYVLLLECSLQRHCSYTGVLIQGSPLKWDWNWTPSTTLVTPLAYVLTLSSSYHSLALVRIVFYFLCYQYINFKTWLAWYIYKGIHDRWQCNDIINVIRYTCQWF